MENTSKRNAKKLEKNKRLKPIVKMTIADRDTPPAYKRAIFAGGGAFNCAMPPIGLLQEARQVYRAEFT